MMLCGGVAIGFAPIGLRLSEFGPQATALWRFLLALPVLAALAPLFGERIGRPPPTALFAGLFFGLDIAFWHRSLTLTSVANATFIVNLGNACVGLLALLVHREKPDRLWPVALAIALFGAFLLSRGAAAAPGALTGDLMALAAACMVAFYLFFARIARARSGPVNVIFWATVAEAIVALTASVASGERIAPAHGLASLLWPALLALVAHSVGQSLIVAGVGRTPSALGGLLLLIQPVTAALAAFLLFKETLTFVQMLGAGLVLAGVALAGRRAAAGARKIPTGAEAA